MRNTTIGGSALLEGLLMIGPENAAIAIRKPDGEVHVEKRDLPVRSRYAKIPVVRGGISFLRQMVLSTRALIFSAEFVEMDAEEEAERKGPLERIAEKMFGVKWKDILIYFSLILSLGFSISLFILLPNLLSGLFRLDKNTYTGLITHNIVEGILRISLFIGYLKLASRLRDMKRVWQYHGAEHKTINCYENEEELTVENVMKYTTKNSRCSTSYLFLVITVSIVLYSFLGWYGLLLNLLVRLLLLPVVAGISYELFRFSVRGDNILTRIITAPGLWLQMLTTKEPDEQQVQVAIAAFNSVRPEESP